VRRYETAASAGARCARRAILYPVRNIDPARERVQGSSLRCFVFRNVVRYESQFYVQSCAQYAHKHTLWYLLTASSFSPAAFLPARPVTAVCSTVGAAEVDRYGNSLIVKKALKSAQESNLLQALYDSKLLSRGRRRDPQIPRARPRNRLEKSRSPRSRRVRRPRRLPLLPTIVNVAPGALPLFAPSPPPSSPPAPRPVSAPPSSSSSPTLDPANSRSRRSPPG